MAELVDCLGYGLQWQNLWVCKRPSDRLLVARCLCVWMRINKNLLTVVVKSVINIFVHSALLKGKNMFRFSLMLHVSMNNVIW